MKIISEGQIVPFGYGIVGINPAYYHGVEIAIIPFNFIKRWWYQQIRKWQPDKYEERLLEVKRSEYSQGYNDGHKEEYERIYGRGKDAFDVALPGILANKKSRDKLKKLITAFEEGKIDIESLSLASQKQHQI